MIGPAPGWEHVDMRLQQGSVRFLVQPVKVVTSMGTVYTEQVAANKANGFEVILQDGVSPTGGPSTDGGTSLATFADVQDAWEFAAIATHYVNARSPAELVDGVVGLIVLFVAAPELFRMSARRLGLGGEDR